MIIKPLILVVLILLNTLKENDNAQQTQQQRLSETLYCDRVAASQSQHPGGPDEGRHPAVSWRCPAITR